MVRASAAFGNVTCRTRRRAVHCVCACVRVDGVSYGFPALGAGVFNVASKLNEMIAKRKKREIEKAIQAAKEADERDSDDDGQ